MFSKNNALNICAVITIFNIGNELYKNLDAISNQVSEVILIDDGSNKETIDLLKIIERDKKATVLYNELNSGISVALNKGIDYAIYKKYDWVITLDQDSIVSPNMINNMLSIYERIPEKLKNEVMMIVPQYIERAFNDINLINKENHNDFYEVINIEITSGNLVKTEAFKKVGKYNEQFFIDFVDIEFCLRCKKLGYLIIRANKAVMYHKIGNSKRHLFLFKQCICTNHNPSRRYYITRNRLYVWHEYFNVDKLWVLKDIKSFIGEIVKIILWEDEKLLKLSMIKRGIKDYEKNIFGKLTS